MDVLVKTGTLSIFMPLFQEPARSVLTGPPPRPCNVTQNTRSIPPSSRYPCLHFCCARRTDTVLLQMQPQSVDSPFSSGPSKQPEFPTSLGSTLVRNRPLPAVCRLSSCWYTSPVADPYSDENPFATLTFSTNISEQADVSRPFPQSMLGPRSGFWDVQHCPIDNHSFE